MPETGIRLILDNYDSFASDLSQLERHLERLESGFEQTVRAANSFDRSLGQSNLNKTVRTLQEAATAADTLANSFDKLSRARLANVRKEIEKVGKALEHVGDAEISQKVERESDQIEQAVRQTAVESEQSAQRMSKAFQNIQFAGLNRKLKQAINVDTIDDDIRNLTRDIERAFKDIDFQGPNFKFDRNIARRFEQLGQRLENVFADTDFEDLSRRLSAAARDGTQDSLRIFSRFAEQAAARIERVDAQLEDNGRRDAGEYVSGFRSALNRGLRAINPNMDFWDFARLGAVAGRDFAEGFRDGLQGLQTELRSVGQDLILSGSALAGAGTGFLGVAINDALQFEDTFAGVRKTVEATNEEFAELQAQVRDLAVSDTPIAGLADSQNEINRILEQAGQLGVQYEALLPFANTIAQLNLSTDLGDNASIQLSRFANILELDVANDIDNIGASLVGLGNNFATTESQIVNFALRVAGTGDIAGLTAQEIFGLVTATSALGVPAERGGTALSRTLQELVIRANTARDAMDEADVSILNTLDSFSGGDFQADFNTDPVETLFEFIEGIAELDEETRLTFLDDMNLGGQRVLDTLLRLSGNTQLVRDAIGEANTAYEENVALVNEATRRYETGISQVNRLRNVFRELRIEVGERLRPVFNAFLAVFNETLELLTQYPDVVILMTSVTIGFGVALIGLGAGLILIANLLTPVIAGATALFLLFSSPFALVGGVVAITGAIVGLTAAFGALVAIGASALATLGIAAFVLRDDFDEIGQALNGVFQSIITLADAVFDAFVGIGQVFGLFQSQSTGVTSAGQSIIDVFNSISTAINAAADNIRSFVDFLNLISTSITTQIAIDTFVEETPIPEIEPGVPDLLTARPVSVSVPVDYTVQPGDTLSNLAREFDTTVEAIVANNPAITDPSLITVGQQIVIDPGIEVAGGTAELRRRIEEEFGDLVVEQDAIDAIVQARLQVNLQGIDETEFNRLVAEEYATLVENDTNGRSTVALREEATVNVSLRLEAERAEEIRPQIEALYPNLTEEEIDIVVSAAVQTEFNADSVQDVVDDLRERRREIQQEREELRELIADPELIEVLDLEAEPIDPFRELQVARITAITAAIQKMQQTPLFGALFGTDAQSPLRAREFADAVVENFDTIQETVGDLNDSFEDFILGDFDQGFENLGSAVARLVGQILELTNIDIDPFDLERLLDGDFGVIAAGIRQSISSAIPSVSALVEDAFNIGADILTLPIRFALETAGLDSGPLDDFIEDVGSFLGSTVTTTFEFIVGDITLPEAIVDLGASLGLNIELNDVQLIIEKMQSLFSAVQEGLSALSSETETAAALNIFTNALDGFIQSLSNLSERDIDNILRLFAVFSGLTFGPALVAAAVAIRVLSDVLIPFLALLGGQLDIILAFNDLMNNLFQGDFEGAEESFEELGVAIDNQVINIRDALEGLESIFVDFAIMVNPEEADDIENFFRNLRVLIDNASIELVFAFTKVLIALEDGINSILEFITNNPLSDFLQDQLGVTGELDPVDFAPSIEIAEAVRQVARTDLALAVVIDPEFELADIAEQDIDTLVENLPLLQDTEAALEVLVDAYPDNEQLQEQLAAVASAVQRAADAAGITVDVPVDLNIIAALSQEAIRTEAFANIDDAGLREQIMNSFGMVAAGFQDDLNLDLTDIDVAAVLVESIQNSLASGVNPETLRSSLTGVGLGRELIDGIFEDIEAAAASGENDIDLGPIAENVVAGFTAALEAGDVQAAGATFAEEFNTGVATGFQIQSPSKVMYAVGTNVVLGLIEGVEAKFGAVTALINRLIAEFERLEELQDVQIDISEMFQTEDTPDVSILLESLSSALADQPTSVGRSIVRGIIEGMFGSLGEAQDSIVEIGEAVFEAFDDYFGGVPSSLMFDFGVGIIQGLINGMLSQLGALTAAVNQIIAIISRIGSTAAMVSAQWVSAMNSISASTIAAAGVVESQGARIATAAQNIISQIQAVQNAASSLNNITLSGTGPGAGAQPFAAGGIVPGGTFAIVGDDPTNSNSGELIFTDTAMAVLNNDTSRAFLSGMETALSYQPMTSNNSIGLGAQAVAGSFQIPDFNMPQVANMQPVVNIAVNNSYSAPVTIESVQGDVNSAQIDDLANQIGNAVLGAMASRNNRSLNDILVEGGAI